MILTPQTVSAEIHDQAELRPGETIHSPDGRYRLAHQHDGNVVLYGPEGAVWHTKTHGKDTSHLVFQGDGNLVLYGPSGPIWHTATHGKGQTLAVQQDSNLVIYGSNGPVWALFGMPKPPPPRPVYASSTNAASDAIHRAFGDLGSGVVGQAHRVAQCESQMNPRALNGNPKYQAAGLFQVIKQWATRYGQITGVPYYDGRFDPYANARFARYLYDDGARVGNPWKHWVCKG